MKQELERASVADVMAVRALIRARIAWLDVQGLNGWNRSDYLNTYPASYFEKMAQAGCLYVCRDECGRMVGSLLLLTEDARWAAQPNVGAYYVHTLVSAVDARGMGRTMLALVEERARREGRACVRLDCKKGNEGINRFYESLGYVAVGECTDGKHHGILREKRL